MNKIKSFTPLLNRCLVRKVAPKPITQGGIILSERTSEKDARFGIVVAVGNGERTETGDIIKPNVSVGDYVLLPEYTGARVEMEDIENEYLIYKETELLGIVQGVKH